MNHRRTLLTTAAVAAVAATALVPGLAHAAPGTFNVRDFGAAGNGSTLDDDAIDRAINAAAGGTGGGVVRFPAGTYQSRTIHLKSNITLQLDAGATVRAAASGMDAAEPNPFSQYQDYGHSHFHNALLWGDGISNVTITGAGTLDGSALETANAVPAGHGDKNLSLTRCANVTLRGITFRSGGHFAVLMNGCDGVLLDSVKVLATKSRDGVNLINTANVEVTNSRIEAQDDALQFGVESCGDFRDVVFQDLKVTGAGKAAIGIVSHDGGSITDVHYARITMTKVSSPVFIRLGGRGKCPGTPPPGRIDNVTITDVTGTNLTTPADVQGADEYASSFIGSPGALISHVSLTNVKLTVPGGHKVSDANLVPVESLTLYRPREWGTRPAYGFWLRHVSGITFTNVDVQFVKNDGRPAFAVDDGRDVRWVDSKVKRSTGPADLRVTRTTGYSLVRTTTTAGRPLRVRAVNSTP